MDAEDRKNTLVHPRSSAETKEADPLLGAVLESRYKVLRRLGSGGMSTVYLAQNLSFDGFVAVKFIRPRVTSTREVMSRCVLEAKALASIPSNYIVRAHDVRTLPNGQIYIVMEYLEGEDLNVLVRREGPLPWRRAAKMIRMVCAGLAAAHKRQLLHRDIKPQNCLRVTLDEDPDHIKLIDFGIAKDVTADHEITETGMILGTPEYMAPELMDERCQPDPRSDLYAVGITLYKLLTGVVPFSGRNPLEICARHSNDPVVPPSQRNSTLRIPPTADLIVLRALAKDPQQRYQTALEMIRDIESTLARSPTGPLPTITMDDLGPSISMPSSAGPARAAPGPLPPLIPAPPLSGSVRPFVGASTTPPPRRETRIIDPLAPNEMPPGRLSRTTQQYGSTPPVASSGETTTRAPNAARRPSVASLFTPATPPAPAAATPAEPSSPAAPPPASSTSAKPSPPAVPSTSPSSPASHAPASTLSRSTTPSTPPVAQLPIGTPPVRVVRPAEIAAKLGLPTLLAGLFALATWRLAVARPVTPPPPPPPERVDRSLAEPRAAPLPTAEPRDRTVTAPLSPPPSTASDAPAAAATPPAAPPTAPPDPTRQLATTESSTSTDPEPPPKPAGYRIRTAGGLLREQREFIQKTCLLPYGAPNKVTMTIIVDKGGEVRSLSSDVRNPDAARCLDQLTRGIVFPTSTHGAAFVYTHPTARTREIPAPIAPSPRGTR